MSSGEKEKKWIFFRDSCHDGEETHEREAGRQAGMEC